MTETFLTSLTDFLTFDFLMLGLAASILLSAICALLSPLVVAKNLAFYSSALSHSTFFSLGLCYFIFTAPGEYQLFYFVLFLSLFLGQMLAWGSYNQKLPADSLVGLYFTGAMGIGILLIEKNAIASQKLNNFLFGNLLLVEGFQVYFLVFTFLLTFLFLKVYRRELLLWCWNPDIARISIKDTFFIHSALFFLITLTLVLGLQVAGIIPMSSLIIVPGMFSSLLAKNQKQHFSYAFFFSIITTLCGVILSNYLNLSLGPSIASFQVIIFILCLPMIKFLKHRMA